jgi:hypothetical protein
MYFGGYAVHQALTMRLLCCFAHSSAMSYTSLSILVSEERNMKQSLVNSFFVSAALGLLAPGCWFSGRTPPGVVNADGMRLIVASENTDPTLRIILPGLSESDRTIEVLFPEHVTVRKQGETEGTHLYLFQPGHHRDQPVWQQIGQSLQYETDFEGGLHMLARATLQDDGVRFRYEFANRSKTSYELIYAPTDPRLTSIFHDVRLERTYVHHKDGFDLLASETPSRLTMPLNHWLPVRYLASFTSPVPPKRVERRDDGVTYYYKSRAVDEPLVATISTDGKWVVASFARTSGNVWSNPELTCQHVDQQIPLAPGATGATETKMLVFRGSLEDVLQKINAQRQTLE